ncbi:unnamed protein product [Withania somnifera]
MNELNCTTFYNSNWENSSMDHQNDPFEFNIVSTESDNFVLRDVIGKLGSICNSGKVSPNSFVDSNNNSCYTTPMSSPPRLNFPTNSATILPHLFANNNLGSCQLSRNMSTKETEFGDSRENSSVSEQITLEENGIKCQNDASFKKGKSIPKRKAKEITLKNANVSTENNESSSKRIKSDEKFGNVKEQNEENQKPQEPSKDYIHVRARRGQATDAHSLAERVRREKIGERMKFLQDLIPGCNKVTGKAVMLDEIINYVQSLQCQVEMFQSLHHSMNSSQTSVQEFPYGFQSQQGPNSQSFLPMDGFVAQIPQDPTFFEDDLHSFIHMGFGQIQANFPGNVPTAQMKAEL